ncbi:hypothetical protein JF535_14940 [Microbulbifer salipaludis]|uniref:Flagellar motor switch protein FliN-like C-terminal domain-containing protein n=1 Tax=Microbulbifer salipaludis TaxID=187980 RepID=A0ABS3EA55_9GAMM|nr:hypothetical protein [Microbulbifer salipaludis]MBN8432146.1 hypothetical protein [Microbulbifer salipaludis]
MRVFNLTGDCSNASKAFPRIDHVSRWLQDWLGFEAQIAAKFQLISPEDTIGLPAWSAGGKIVLISQSVIEFVDCELSKLSHLCSEYNSRSAFHSAVNVLLDQLEMDPTQCVDVLPCGIAPFDVLKLCFKLPSGQAGFVALSAECVVDSFKSGVLKRGSITSSALKNDVDLVVNKKINVDLSTVRSVRPGETISLGALDDFSWRLSIETEDVGLTAYLGRDGDKRAVVIES